MIIVLDTNILYESHFEDPSFVALFDLLSRSEDDSLVIPQLVIDETVNLCREAIAKIHKTMNQQIQHYHRWTRENLLSPLTDDKVQVAIATYQQNLNVVLSKVEADIRRYPKTSHEVLVARSLARKKPFTEDGQRGYRDALIWASILDILVETSSGEVTFVTKNSKDFFERDRDILHPHLIADLHENNIDVERIKVVKDLHSFVDTYVKHTMKKLDLESVRVDFSLGLGRYTKEDIEDAILQALNAYQYSDVINPHDVGLPPEVETINVSYVEEISDIHTVDARELTSGGWFINATATAHVDFDFFIYKGDSYILEEGTSIGVNDYDWNDHYIWAQADKLVEVTLSLTFNEQTGTVTAIEINAFSPLQPYRTY
jgi:predicted nucleic acid-binding protein